MSIKIYLITNESMMVSGHNDSDLVTKLACSGYGVERKYYPSFKKREVAEEYLKK